MPTSSSDPINVDALWRQYRTQPTEALRNVLMQHYLPQVRYIAERLLQKLPSSFELDDLIQTGVMGLFDAVDGFDPDRGVKFETYCTQRIRGAILDELRKLDWVPRLVRTKASELQHAYRDLEYELGRRPTDFEMAERLGVSLEDFDRLVQEASTASIVSLSKTTNESEESKGLRKIDMLEDKRSSNPLASLERKELIEVITRGLSRKEQLIIILYYYEELTMREIGSALDLSESRVCQLHSRVMLRLKSQLARLKDELMG